MTLLHNYLDINSNAVVYLLIVSLKHKYSFLLNLLTTYFSITFTHKFTADKSFYSTFSWLRTPHWCKLTRVRRKLPNASARKRVTMVTSTTNQVFDNSMFTLLPYHIDKYEIKYAKLSSDSAKTWLTSQKVTLLQGKFLYLCSLQRWNLSNACKVLL